MTNLRRNRRTGLYRNLPNRGELSHSGSADSHSPPEQTGHMPKYAGAASTEDHSGRVAHVQSTSASWLLSSYVSSACWMSSAVPESDNVRKCGRTEPAWALRCQEMAEAGCVSTCNEEVCVVESGLELQRTEKSSRGRTYRSGVSTGVVADGFHHDSLATSSRWLRR
ncbi:hypothetical protein BDW62DRAFT_135358 [Aspergillus aurantiobrunneus]